MITDKLGFLQRFQLMVFPDPHPDKGKDQAENQAAWDAAHAVFTKADELEPQSIPAKQEFRKYGEELEPMLPFLLSSLADLNVGNRRFRGLTTAEQDELLTSIEDGEFFDTMWSLTMFGFFAMSRYGGNKDNIAWDLIGFEGDHGAWQYPFGYYDAEYAKEKSNG